jgi:hypothetical protein
MKQTVAPFLLNIGFLVGFAGAVEPSPELDVQATVGPAAEARLVLPVEVALYETRRADRLLARLPAGQEVVVLGMDAHGLKIQARSGRGPTKGWVSRKLVYGSSEETANALEAWYQRELVVATLVANKTPALNLTTMELERIFGPPSRRSMETVDAGRGTRERLEWIHTEELDLNKAFGATLSILNKDALQGQVETGRLIAEVSEGIVRSIEGALSTAPAAATVEVAPPLPCPFTIVPIKVERRL